MPTLSPILSRELAVLPGIKHAFFTRPGGVSRGIYAGLNAGLGSNDVREDVIVNRNKMADYLGVKDDQLASPYQVHSADALSTDTAWTDSRPKADAVVANRPGLAVGIVTADCGPVLFADPQARVVAAAHAGWKGALSGVLENTLAEMEKQGALRANITAVLGPMISQASYEVGPDFPAPFLADSNDNRRFFKPSQSPGHHMFDLAGYIVARLVSAGVNASLTGNCTYKDEENFYSYRRTTHRNEPDYGRQMSAIVITD